MYRYEAGSGSPTHTSARSRVIGVLFAASLLAVLLNSGVAAAAARLGANAEFLPLTLPLYGAFTVAGVIGGWFGWRLVTKRVTNVARVMRILVPAVGIASWAPDLLLLAVRFIPDTNAAGVMALMLMHAVVIAVAVPSYLVASRQLARSAELGQTSSLVATPGQSSPA